MLQKESPAAAQPIQKKRSKKIINTHPAKEKTSSKAAAQGTVEPLQKNAFAVPPSTTKARDGGRRGEERVRERGEGGGEGRRRERGAGEEGGVDIVVVWEDALFDGVRDCVFHCHEFWSQVESSLVVR